MEIKWKREGGLKERKLMEERKIKNHKDVGGSIVSC
jgi:hypothetical protein